MNSCGQTGGINSNLAEAQKRQGEIDTMVDDWLAAEEESLRTAAAEEERQKAIVREKERQKAIVRQQPEQERVVILEEKAKILAENAARHSRLAEEAELELVAVKQALVEAADRYKETMNQIYIPSNEIFSGMGTKKKSSKKKKPKKKKPSKKKKAKKQSNHSKKQDGGKSRKPKKAKQTRKRPKRSRSSRRSRLAGYNPYPIEQ